MATLPGVAADPAAPGYTAFAERLAGAEIRLSSLAAKPDRWGRAPAAAFLGDRPESLGEQILEAGLARYLPDPAARPCRDRLLAAEAAARAAKRGLWAMPGAALDAGDARAILAAPRGLALVEGRILSIGERRGRLYLNFGPRRTTDFTIVISKRNLALFDAARIPVRELAGRRLRARGLVDRGFGPLMEIGTPDALEILDGGAQTADVKQ
ncbi:MAG TPA: thermonuclease family protein [Rhodoblastus sp.]|nr:thermonuclease family protein [Rhodoblastus sp.]